MKLYHLSLVLFAATLCLCESYTLRNSWAVASNDAVGLWKPAYPHSVLQDGAEKPKESVKSKTKDAAPVSSASRVFSYRMEEMTAPASAPSPPPQQDTARTVRYMGQTLCPQIKGLPFGNIFSVSDGPKDNSTGVLCFYVTLMNNTVADLKKGDFCRQQMYDPEDPRCARLTLTGKMVEVDPEEVEFAKEAMFSRHPVMKKWPVGHNWFVMKLQLTQVWLQDWVGGVSLIALEDYFKATPY
uniref:CREG-like beta-barrel domain-containing protein n=1 Tax=Oncorhynchus tshawytscha TaxID=74940 RepID=A0A8C8DFY3_ONCTS